MKPLNILTISKNYSFPLSQLTFNELLCAHWEHPVNPILEPSSSKNGPWLTSPVRNDVLDQLMEEKQRVLILLSALEKGIVQPSALGWSRTVILMRDTEGDVKNRARALLSEPPGVREEAVQTYTGSIDLEGDISNGEAVFARVCSTCHQVAGNGGIAFGPDLGTVRHWSPEALIASILIPQRTITDGYGLWTIDMKDGTSMTGLIASESPSDIEVRRLGQRDVSIPRESITSLANLNASAMPDGLEAQLSKQEMADLIAFLRFN